jgi:hypothetical protein
MSLYNILFGQNPLSTVYLAMVGLTPSDTGRFRDAYVEKTADNGWVLHVYTRNGGGNREHYNDEEDSGPDCDCTGCIGGYRLPANVYYLKDEDDDFDCTYATFSFKIPRQFWSFLEDLETNASPEMKPTDRWTNLFAKLSSSKDDPEVKNVMHVMTPVLTKLTSVIEELKAKEATGDVES